MMDRQKRLQHYKKLEMAIAAVLVANSFAVTWDGATGTGTSTVAVIPTRKEDTTGVATNHTNMGVVDTRMGTRTREVGEGSGTMGTTQARAARVGTMDTTQRVGNREDTIMLTTVVTEEARSTMTITTTIRNVGRILVGKTRSRDHE